MQYHLMEIRIRLVPSQKYCRNISISLPYLLFGRLNEQSCGAGRKSAKARIHECRIDKRVNYDILLNKLEDIFIVITQITLISHLYLYTNFTKREQNYGNYRYAKYNYSK